MSEVDVKLGINPRRESLMNIWKDWRFILRGQVVVVGIETSLLDQEQSVDLLTGKLDTRGMVEDAVHKYLENE